MKKTISFLLLFVLIKHGTAQNIGIGTAIPAARVHINHKNTADTASLLLLDSANGTGSSIHFKKLSGNGSFFGIKGMITNSAINDSLVIHHNNNSILTLKGDGNVGVGTSTPGQKLDVNGNLKVSGVIMPDGISGTNGQVLTSRGSVNSPTWEKPFTNTGFSAVKFSAANATIQNNVVTKIIFDDEDVDDEGYYDVATGDFTAVTSGFYCFQATIKYSFVRPASLYKIYIIKVLTNGTEKEIASQSQHISIINDQSSDVSLNASISAELLQGEKIRIKTYQNVGNTAILESGGGATRFSGFKIH